LRTIPGAMRSLPLPVNARNGGRAHPQRCRSCTPLRVVQKRGTRSDPPNFAAVVRFARPRASQSHASVSATIVARRFAGIATRAARCARTRRCSSGESSASASPSALHVGDDAAPRLPVSAGAFAGAIPADVISPASATRSEPAAPISNPTVAGSIPAGRAIDAETRKPTWAERASPGDARPGDRFERRSLLLIRRVTRLRTSGRAAISDEGVRDNSARATHAEVDDSRATPRRREHPRTRVPVSTIGAERQPHADASFDSHRFTPGRHVESASSSSSKTE
jgi:hypothetical protein